MAEYSSNAIQTVNPGESIVFTDTPDPCKRGFVRHREGSGEFLLRGWVPNRPRTCNCSFNRDTSAEFFVDFGANIAIPEGGTVGPISVALTLDGTTIPATTMIVTPAAVDQYFNVSRAANVSVWKGCCQSFAIRNTSNQPILVQNTNVVFTRPDLAVTY